MSDLWPCRCGNEGIRNLGVNGYCTTCYTQLVNTFDPAVFAMNGIWMLDGVVRPDHGPRYAECRCPACDATAVAIIGTPCAYCQISLEHTHIWQTDLVLTAPDHHPDDPRRDDALTAWAERLAVAVTAELIDADQARQAMKHAET